MKRAEYLEKIQGTEINTEVVTKIETLYGYPLPLCIQKMVSYSEAGIFFDDGYRTLSVAEILEAEHDLHVDFISQHMIPVIDCSENDFVVYLFCDKVWSKFNIVDECFFKRRTSLHDLM